MTAATASILLQVDVQSPGDVEELQGVLGLPLQLNPGGKDRQLAPALPVPCQAPFTSMLPDVMRLAHRSVKAMLTMLLIEPQSCSHYSGHTDTTISHS